jgi:Gpi18-like mannosyltransferase
MNWELLIFPSKLVWFWDEKGMDLMVKLPSILADIGVAWVIFKYFEIQKKFKIGVIISAVWLFNPVTWYNSSVWGQTDSIVNLLGLIAIFALLEKKLTKFLLFFTLSFLFKGSLGIFIPVLLFIAISQKYPLKAWITSVAYSLSAVALISIWFHPNPDLPVWLFKLYKERILPGEIGYLTANAFNFWWLVDPGKIPDNTLYFGLPARVWGFGSVFVLVCLIILWLKKNISEKRIFYSLAFLSLASFLFLTRIHERYLFPFFPYATLLLGIVPNFWAYYVAVSLAHLLNLYHLFWAPGVPYLESMYKNQVFSDFLAAINLAVFLLFLRHLKLSKI